MRIFRNLLKNIDINANINRLSNHFNINDNQCNKLVCDISRK